MWPCEPFMIAASRPCATKRKAPRVRYIVYARGLARGFPSEGYADDAGAPDSEHSTSRSRSRARRGELFPIGNVHIHLLTPFALNTRRAFQATQTKTGQPAEKLLSAPLSAELRPRRYTPSHETGQRLSKAAGHHNVESGPWSSPLMSATRRASKGPHVPNLGHKRRPGAHARVRAGTHVRSHSRADTRRRYGPLGRACVSKQLHICSP